MKNIGLILFCTYYLLGSTLLPCGDFAFLEKIPAMYRNCKATEDKDMTPLDFITDHLVNFDCWFDAHDKGDLQKPHQTQQKLVNDIQHLVYKFETIFRNNPGIKIQEMNFCFIELKNPSDFNTSVFRPPIV
jgi:hypothetical protein